MNEHEASLDFYNSKHEDFEMQRDNTERDLDCLHQRSDDLSSHITDLEAKIDDLEQYSRRNCLILNGCQEKQAESQPVIHDQDVNEQKDQEEDNTDEIVLDVFRNIMDMRISIDEIERTHRLGRKAIINSSREDKSPKSGRPIIIKFSTYRKRQEIFSNKKKIERIWPRINGKSHQNEDASPRKGKRNSRGEKLLDCRWQNRCHQARQENSNNFKRTASRETSLVNETFTEVVL